MKDNAMKNARKLLLRTALRGNWPYLLLGALAVVGSAAASYATPLVVSFTVDTVLLGGAVQLPAFIQRLLPLQSGAYYLEHIWQLGAALVVVALVGGLFQRIKGSAAARASEGAAKQLRDALYRHLQDVPYDYHKHVSTGDLVQRCSSDVDMIRRFMSVQMLEIVRTIAMVGIALAVLLSIHARLAWISVSALPLLFAFSFVYFSRVRKLFTDSDEAEGRLSTFMQENFSGIRVVRAFGQQQNEVEGFEKRDRDFRDVTCKLSDMLGVYWGTSDAIGYIQIFISLAVGIRYAAMGSLSVGNVLVFFTYTNMLVWPVRQLGRVLSDFGKATVSLDRLAEIMAVPAETESGRALTPPIQGNIEFKNVCFGYDTPDEVLKDVSFSVKAGQTVAILGSTGSGKSSLVHLLQRLYPCTRGHISIDGVDVNDIERHYLRKNIGIVLQEPFLYSRTILENIRITQPDAPIGAVEEAARVAAVHDVIESFDKGYDTIVGERGVTLSGGQKQRVAIARMLMQNAPILIFDDSMSAVDTETDAAIRDALAARRRDVTTFIISHRVTTLCEADFILVLDKGRIAETGTHEQLLAADGIYSRIARIQSLAADAEGGEA